MVHVFKGFSLIRLIERHKQEGLIPLPHKSLPPVTFRIRQPEQRRNLASSIGFVGNGTRAGCTSPLQLPSVCLTTQDNLMFCSRFSGICTKPAVNDFRKHIYLFVGPLYNVNGDLNKVSIQRFVVDT